MSHHEPNGHTLAQLNLGERAVIRGYQGSSDVSHRLRELGLVKGTEIYVKRFAPFGDPMEVCVRGYCLSLRKKDAEQVLVERIQVHDAH